MMGCCADSPAQCQCADGYQHGPDGRCIPEVRCDLPEKMFNCGDEMWGWELACPASGCCQAEYDDCECNHNNGYYKTESGYCGWFDETNGGDGVCYDIAAPYHCASRGAGTTCRMETCCVADFDECMCEEGFYMDDLTGQCKKLEQCTDPMKMVNCLEFGTDFYACPKGGCCVTGFDECACATQNGFFKSEFGECITANSTCYDMAKPTHCGYAGQGYACSWMDGCCAASVEDCTCEMDYIKRDGECHKIEDCWATYPSYSTNCAMDGMGWYTCPDAGSPFAAAPGSCCVDNLFNCECADGYVKNPTTGECMSVPACLADCPVPIITSCDDIISDIYQTECLRDCFPDDMTSYTYTGMAMPMMRRRRSRALLQMDPAMMVGEPMEPDGLMVIDELGMKYVMSMCGSDVDYANLINLYVFEISPPPVTDDPTDNIV